jgi:hypothetical protein
LLAVIRDLTRCLILATGIKVEERIELPEPKPGQPYGPIYEPITLAALSHHAAFGVIAIAAATLGSLEDGGRPRHHWRPDCITGVMNAAALVVWLPPDKRRLLETWSTSWERPAGDALRAVIAEVEIAA